MAAGRSGCWAVGLRSAWPGDEASTRVLRRIRALAKLWRQRGVDVLEQAWDSSAHCAHLRHHPQEYAQAVEALLTKARDAFTRRHGRRAAGVPPAASLRSRL